MQRPTNRGGQSAAESSAASQPRIAVAGFARIPSFRQLTEVWRLQLPMEPKFLTVTKH